MHRPFVGKVVCAACAFIGINAERSFVDGNTAYAIQVLIIKFESGVKIVYFCDMGKLFHVVSSTERFEPEAIDLDALLGNLLVDVDVALVVVALEVGAVDVLQFVELHGVNPSGALFMVALFAVGTSGVCQQESADCKDEFCEVSFHLNQVYYNHVTKLQFFFVNRQLVLVFSAIVMVVFLFGQIKS